MLRHNYHALRTEIDLLTLDAEGRLHAVEVKRWSRASLAFAHPLERFDRRRLATVHAAVRTFLGELESNAPEAIALREAARAHAPGFDPRSCDVIPGLALVDSDGAVELELDLLG